MSSKLPELTVKQKLEKILCPQKNDLGNSVSLLSVPDFLSLNPQHQLLRTFHSSTNEKLLFQKTLCKFSSSQVSLHNPSIHRTKLKDLAKWADEVCESPEKKGIKESQTLGIQVLKTLVFQLIDQVNASSKTQGYLFEKAWSGLFSKVEKAFEECEKEALERETSLLKKIEQIHKIYQNKLAAQINEIDELKTLIKADKERSAKLILENAYLRKISAKNRLFQNHLKSRVQEIEELNQKLFRENVQMSLEVHDIDSEMYQTLNRQYLQSIRNSLHEMLEDANFASKLSSEKLRKLKILTREIEKTGISSNISIRKDTGGLIAEAFKDALLSETFIDLPQAEQDFLYDQMPTFFEAGTQTDGIFGYFSESTQTDDLIILCNRAVQTRKKHILTEEKSCEANPEIKEMCCQTEGLYLNLDKRSAGINSIENSPSQSPLSGFGFKIKKAKTTNRIQLVNSMNNEAFILDNKIPKFSNDEEITKRVKTQPSIKKREEKTFSPKSKKKNQKNKNKIANLSDLSKFKNEEEKKDEKPITIVEKTIEFLDVPIKNEKTKSGSDFKKEVKTKDFLKNDNPLELINEKKLLKNEELSIEKKIENGNSNKKSSDVLPKKSDLIEDLQKKLTKNQQKHLRNTKNSIKMNETLEKNNINLKVQEEIEKKASVEIQKTDEKIGFTQLIHILKEEKIENEENIISSKSPKNKEKIEYINSLLSKKSKIEENEYGISIIPEKVSEVGLNKIEKIRKSIEKQSLSNTQIKNSLNDIPSRRPSKSSSKTNISVFLSKADKDKSKTFSKISIRNSFSEGKINSQLQTLSSNVNNSTPRYSFSRRKSVFKDIKENNFTTNSNPYLSITPSENHSQNFHLPLQTNDKAIQTSYQFQSNYNLPDFKTIDGNESHSFDFLGLESWLLSQEIVLLGFYEDCFEFIKEEKPVKLFRKSFKELMIVIKDSVFQIISSLYRNSPDNSPTNQIPSIKRSPTKRHQTMDNQQNQNFSSHRKSIGKLSTLIISRRESLTYNDEKFPQLIQQKIQESNSFQLIHIRFLKELAENKSFSPLSQAFVYKIISFIYHEAIKRVKKGEKIENFEVFLYDYFTEKYGLKIIAENKILQLLHTCHKGNFYLSARINAFQNFLTINHSKTPWNFYLYIKSIIELDESAKRLIGVFNIERISTDFSKSLQAFEMLFKEKVENENFLVGIKEIYKIFENEQKFTIIDKVLEIIQTFNSKIN